jgi:hypothetical protein
MLVVLRFAFDAVDLQVHVDCHDDKSPSWIAAELIGGITGGMHSADAFAQVEKYDALLHSYSATE